MASKPWHVPDDDVVDAVREAVADGQRDGANGGVHPDALADYSVLAAGTLHDRCSDLAEQGRLVRVDGLGPNLKPRKSYLPADHTDVASSEDGEVWAKP